jgi:hypothetical protein
MRENESKRGKDDMDFPGRRKVDMIVFGVLIHIIANIYILLAIT